ncbi:MAG: uracil-DNA glycosylase [Anaerolineales bacterium]
MLTPLESLNADLIACQRCPRLIAYCQEVARVKRRAYRDQDYWGKPIPGLGDPRAQVLMVGLAPAAHGANRTGRMFTGDGSGDFLTPALYRAGFSSQPTSKHIGDGLRLINLYMAAAAHCAPPGNKPTPQEIANCRPYLVEHLRRLTEARIIIALGKIGFDAVLAELAEAGTALPSPRPAFGHLAEHALGRYILIASYHPSRQNTQTGRLTAAMFDRVFARANELLALPVG